MKLITEVVVMRDFPLLLDGRLYEMSPGDVLTVASEARDKIADITADEARNLIFGRFVAMPGVEQGEGE